MMKAQTKDPTGGLTAAVYADEWGRIVASLIRQAEAE